MNGSSVEHNYNGLGDAISKLYKQDGLAGFYKGYNATLAKSIPMCFFLFVIND